MPEEKVSKTLCDERHEHIKETLVRIEAVLNPSLPMLRQELKNHKQQHKRAWFKVYVLVVGVGVLFAVISFLFQRFG